MWKTIDSESVKCRLCPTCDSLGPHLAREDEDTEETLLDCIDCGTPLGLEPETPLAGQLGDLTRV